jgi:hypothetical protein
MSNGTDVGLEPHNDANVSLGQKPTATDASELPNGLEPDHHDPDSFSVRCTNCGHLDTKDSRARAHRKADNHGLNCAPTGVTPVSELRVATDGGSDLEKLVSVASPMELVCKGCNECYRPLVGTPGYRLGTCEDCTPAETWASYQRTGYRRFSDFPSQTPITDGGTSVGEIDRLLCPECGHFDCVFHAVKRSVDPRTQPEGSQ